MRLNHQRIALSRFVVAWLVQSGFTLLSFVVLPLVKAGLPQVEVFELWVRVPKNSRCLSVRSHQQGSLIKPLLNGDIQTILVLLDSGLLALPNQLPSCLTGLMVLVAVYFFGKWLVKTYADALFISMDETSPIHNIFLFGVFLFFLFATPCNFHTCINS